MDPNACLKELIEAIKDGDRDETISHLVSLAGWLANGGFMPTLPTENT